MAVRLMEPTVGPEQSERSRLGPGVQARARLFFALSVAVLAIEMVATLIPTDAEVRGDFAALSAGFLLVQVSAAWGLWRGARWGRILGILLALLTLLEPVSELVPEVGMQWGAQEVALGRALLPTIYMWVRVALCLLFLASLIQIRTRRRTAPA
jgi:hypothetical protein